MDVGILSRRDVPPLLRLPFPNLEKMLRQTFSVFERAVAHYYSLSQHERERCELPETTKREIDLGFIDKSPEQGFDNKIFFHYRPDVQGRLEGDVFTELLIQCDELYRCALRQSLEVVAELERCRKPHLNGLLDMVRDHHGHRLRLLWYREGAGVLAKRHPDHTFLTDHLGETHDGFMVECQGSLQPVEVFKDQSCFFAGRKAPLATDGWIPEALEHAVIRDEVLQERRMAAVFFLHGPWRLPDTEH